MNKFVTFEGGEGAGKSTLVNNLRNYLKQNKIDFVVTREPGGLPICEKIRDLVLTSPVDTKSQLLLFSTSRSILVNNLIKPSLEDGKIVLCDRFYDSSRVYQGYCGGISDEDVMKITQFATQGLEPEITFYLDIDPIVAFKRKQTIDENDVFETKNIEFHQKVRQGFLELAKKEKDRIVVLDATQPSNKLLDIVIKKLKEKGII